MNLIGIDYQHCATGNYLAYIGNVFLIPTVPFHNPFMDNGTSHKRLRNHSSVFREGHYWLNRPNQYPIVGLHQMVWINVAPEDFEKFRLVKIAKVGNGYAPDNESHFQWSFTKSLIFDDSLKPPWVQDKSAFIFNWGSLFSEQTFFLELEQLCSFCNITFCPTAQLSEIHKEFLFRHSYIL